MIRAKFFIGNSQLSGFEISGHACCGSQGNDIVCAAVSSAAYMAANTLTDVIGANCSVEAGDARIYVHIPEPDNRCCAVLKGFELHMRELAQSYPKNIKVIYGGVK